MFQEFDKKAFQSSEGFLLEYVFLATDIDLIKSHSLIDLSRIFIDATAHVEYIRPTLLRQPGGNLGTAAAMMTHHVDGGILYIGGIG